MKIPHLEQNLLNDRNVQIGNICWQWAHLEYLIALAAWSLLRIDNDTGRLITGGMNILPRVNLALNLARHLKAPQQAQKALKETRKALQKGLDERRNRVVHGHRFLDRADPQAEFVEMHRGKNAGVKVRQTNKDLAQLGRDIADTARALHQAMLESGVYSDIPGQRPARVKAARSLQMGTKE